MKNKLPVFVIALLMIAIPFKIAFLSQVVSNFANISCFLSVIIGFLILLIFGSNDGQEAGH
ncbi:MAG TPA: hypothetical protein VNZ86_09600 [Bacteroidia bacterium]|nr:hypothetical protein [Bacteroidia bacterium]